MKKAKELIAIIIITFASLAMAEVTGKEIMTKVDERPDGKDSKSKMTMTLINKRGQKRVRQIVSFGKEVNDGDKSLIYFTEPADVSGTAFLSWEYDEVGKDDDSWLYLPALKKSRRINSSSENDYFMGSDFTYDDMGDRSVEEDNHNFLREEKIDGHDCWVIESTPNDKNYMYSRRISWIRKDALIALKVEYFDQKGVLLKTLTTKDIVKIKDIWSIKYMEMKHHQNNHTTIIETDDIQYDIGIEDNMFNVSNLERLRIK